jgi:hypothetical protein
MFYYRKKLSPLKKRDYTNEKEKNKTGVNFGAKTVNATFLNI